MTPNAGAPVGEMASGTQGTYVPGISRLAVRQAAMVVLPYFGAALTPAAAIRGPLQSLKIWKLK